VGRYPLEETWGYIQGCEGIHNGFCVLESDEGQDDGRYQVMQQVVIGGLKGMVSKTVHQELLMFNYFDLDSNCLVVDEINDIFCGDKNNPVDFCEQMEVVKRSSRELNLLLRSTTFRRTKRSKQIRQVDSLVARAELDSNICGTEILAEAECGYITDFNMNMHLMPVDIRDAVIGGLCLGLETLESFALRMRAIRRDANLIDKGAGMCLVIAPNPETKQGLHLRDEQALFIPFCQNITLEEVKQ